MGVRPQVAQVFIPRNSQSAPGMDRVQGQEVLEAEGHLVLV